VLREGQRNYAAGSKAMGPSPLGWAVEGERFAPSEAFNTAGSISPSAKHHGQNSDYVCAGIMSAEYACLRAALAARWWSTLAWSVRGATSPRLWGRTVQLAHERRVCSPCLPQAL